MKRETKRNQPSFPEIKLLVQGIVWVPPWVCPSCSPRPADSMLQSGTLFTFWTQLTSPSHGPSVLPSPSLHFSFSLSLFLSQSLSPTSLGFRLQPSLARSSTCRGLPKTLSRSTQRTTSLLLNESRLQRFMLNSLWCHTHTTQWGAMHNNHFMLYSMCLSHCQDQSCGGRIYVCFTAYVFMSKKSSQIHTLLSYKADAVWSQMWKEYLKTILHTTKSHVCEKEADLSEEQSHVSFLSLWRRETYIKYTF